MDVNRKQLVADSIKLAVEATVAFLLVVGVCWGLCNWAEHQADRPIKADADGVVSLPVAAATLAGNVERGPNDKEQQTSDFAYHFGRELLAERNSRTIRAWTGEDSSVEWRFAVEHADEDKEQSLFQVTARLAAASSSAGNRFTVSIECISSTEEPKLVKRFESTVADTGGMDKWRDVLLGQIELAAGTYRLTVSPEGPIKGSRLLGLARIELRPGK
ncbi:MAG: hypothetical protein U9N87_04115 [Planctomycetota bacterium]|nr:hypothetical protein [Planctomycetota bacterium]